MMIVGFSMYVVGLMMFCFKGFHFLLMLLSLEFIMLSLYFYLFIYMFMIGCEFYFMMYFLVMAVCEGALGISILVSLIYSFGNDYVQSFNVMW